MMHAELLLCDYADVQAGKLYIAGGGWSWIGGPLPIDFTVAVRLSVPWNQANRQHTFHLELLTEDGDSVVVNGGPMEISGDFNVGRPPDATPGADLVNPLTFRFGQVTLGAGRYEVALHIDGERIAEAPFELKRPDGWKPPA